MTRCSLLIGPSGGKRCYMLNLLFNTPKKVVKHVPRLYLLTFHPLSLLFLCLAAKPIALCGQTKLNLNVLVSNSPSTDLCAAGSVHVYHRSTNQDYKGSGFDRGHLAAAANHKWSQKAMDDTFILSNVSPQVRN